MNGCRSTMSGLPPCQVATKRSYLFIGCSLSMDKCAAHERLTPETKKDCMQKVFTLGAFQEVHGEKGTENKTNIDIRRHPQLVV